MAAFPNARFLISAAAPEQYPADRGAEVAFAGRSNAGKSSAINAIVGRQGLARTSKTPGRTRLINFFELSPHERIVDLPGYGYARAPESERRTWPRLLEALRQRDALKGLFVIVDARRGIGEGDEALLAWALPRQRAHVLLSKADKLSRNEGRQVLAAAARALGGRATVQLFSAHAHAGLEEAQGVLRVWLSAKEKTPMTSGEATGAD
ncbi:MAG: YihA family ribosome biogenesis GTP-binding protein [Gammaproteobacteria bacterium]|nr:YihA family ribosome biogenesis GTP-binding protein [Gammaproteobacteria bacterium]